MKKKIISTAIMLVIMAAGGYILYRKHNTKVASDGYQFAEVSRGNIETSISCTGTINAVGTVEVGTQVSGTLARLYVDFNDKVSKGQLLAVLDTTVLKAALVASEADVAQSQAQFEKATADYNRNQPLADKGYLSAAEMLPFQTALETSKAGLTSSKAQSERAVQNLGYAYIRSPISGTVIQRNVEQGQTVAASLSAPTLFVIAEDLSKMEIHALVDESDIGMIHDGQSVRFSVPAYFGKEFYGTVRQVRLQPDVVQNVVNYTAIVDAENQDNLLLPGMTATADFITEQKNDVLLVSNSALSFQPSEEALAKMPNRGGGEAGSSGGGQRGAGRKFWRSDSAAGDSASFRAKRGNRKALWYLDDGGNLAAKRVSIGISNGKVTELTSEGIDVGFKVISGINGGTAGKTQSTGLFGPPMMPMGRMR